MKPRFTPTRRARRKRRALEMRHLAPARQRRVAGVLFICFGFFVGGYYLTAAPANFTPVNALRIAPGASVTAVAKELTDAHLIAHPLVLRAIFHLTGASGSIQAGVYHFSNPENLLLVAYRLVTGDFGIAPVRMTFVEGVTSYEIAAQLASSTLDIPEKDFYAAAKKQEGYLFPDTYFFQPSDDTTSIIAQMKSNFDSQIAPLLPEIDASGHSLKQIITMASLVEKEARTTKDRKMVAGILWNRIKHNMPLQVDAVFGYIFEKQTYSPSYADLKVKSPYNTYIHTGLPPGPICNPGLDAIEATLKPTPNNYLYYLTDKHGVMHYARTYAGQLANERRYL